MKRIDYEEIIDILTPKIKRALKETTFQEQEELEQELKIKILKQIDNLKVDLIPNFFDLLSKE
ncbi:MULTISPECIES: hypothetical protein [Psychrobacillus]|uniref:Helix-turn-helix domain-containing protein n=1 Tax=Psychrobacillus lasiicapitis TaxID=1636719 RepID=A0A544SZT7_9BACI|nr:MULTISPECIES: hypothetical protein [Psychrobacillus]MDI2586598.1 hypothetical protein [Psychrobacillus sp. NEAU-3TGS]TQR10716.1 hypothetical protein FG382_16760 [Psychrobacillus lasiicapitis]GGA43112.1 hypothetical protein GCM10011384_36110 [Psychrobacillus lasiicapitis]